MTFDEYLELDHANGKKTLALLRELDQKFSARRGREKTVHELLDDAWALFETFNRAYGQGCSEPDRLASATGASCARALGVPAKELGVFLDSLSGPDPDPTRQASIDSARGAVQAIHSRGVRGILLPSIGRSYVFAVTDLLRLRLGPSVGYQRLAAEAAALIELIRGAPAVAREWRDAPMDGQQFYFDHQAALKAIMRARGLETAYNRASGIAQHVRLTSLAHGLQVSSGVEGDQYHYEVRLAFQDLPDGPEQGRSLLLYVLDLLTFFGLVFEVLPHGLPEITDALLLQTRIPSFREHVRLNLEKFKRTYPEWSARAFAAGAAAP